MNTWRDSKDLWEQAIFELPFYKREGSSSHSEQYLQRLGTLLWSVQRKVSPQGWMEHRILGNKTRKMVWLEGRWVSPYSTNRYSECTRSQLLDQQGWLLKNTVHFLCVRRFVRHLVHTEEYSWSLKDGETPRMEKHHWRLAAQWLYTIFYTYLYNFIPAQSRSKFTHLETWVCQATQSRSWDHTNQTSKRNSVIYHEQHNFWYQNIYVFSSGHCLHRINIQGDWFYTIKAFKRADNQSICHTYNSI